MNWLAVFCVAVAIGAWVAAVVSYQQMMRGVPLAVARLHCARLRIRANLLFLRCPELFDGRAATYRRRYIAATLAFLIAIVAGALAGLLAQH